MKFGRRWYLRGIISSSLLDMGICDTTKAALYTNIPNYINWINQETGNMMEVQAEESTVKSSVLAEPATIISRSEWKALPPKPDKIALKTPLKRVMISHTVTPECANRESCSASLSNMQYFHMQVPHPDFNDIYCNFLIGGDGLIFEGRGWKVRGEHTVGRETHNGALCIAFIGNYSNKLPKQSQIDSFFKLLAYGVAIDMLDEDYVINAQRDCISTESPGLAFYNLIKTWERYAITAGEAY